MKYLPDDDTLRRYAQERGIKTQDGGALIVIEPDGPRVISIRQCESEIDQLAEDGTAALAVERNRGPDWLRQVWLWMEGRGPLPEGMR